MAEKKVEKKIEKKENGKVKLEDIKPVVLTAEEFEKKTPEEVAKMILTPQNILSRERAIKELVARVSEGRVKIDNPVALMDWTYKHVMVDGVAPETKSNGTVIPLKGVDKATETLSKEKFAALDAEGKAALISKYTFKNRAANHILPELIKKGMPVSAEDIVYLTNGRISVKGVTVPQSRIGGGSSSVAVTEGVSFA